MGLTAVIVGAVGGLCAIIGIIAAAEVVELLIPQQFTTWNFWFSLSAILLLASIAFALGRSYE